MMIIKVPSNPSNPNGSMISACPSASSGRGHLLPSEDTAEKKLNCQVWSRPKTYEELEMH